MAKTIKFNLICDGKPIRTLDDLRNNFCVEDVLAYFRNGLLQRWLTVRGFTEELEKVKAVAPADDLKTILELVKIFGVDDALTDIERDTYIFTYRQEHTAQLAKYEAEKAGQAEIIRDYHAEYEALIDTIIDHKDDMPKIKAALQEIAEKHYELFSMQSANLVRLFLERAPMAIFAMLMREDMREDIMAKVDDEEDYMRGANIDENHDVLLSFSDISENILNMVQVGRYDVLKRILGDNLKEFSGVTEGYWKDIEPVGRRCMILRMESGNFIRPASQSGADMSADDVNGNFLILNGIDYKSNSSYLKLLYMEV
ncbi:MAG: hypothetical protein IJS39_00130 [Synergistaceae bacterium]|nr:hypothetical protein [Synergistaceae bacterium]